MAKKYGSIQLIYKELNTLALENEVFLIGQTIWVTVAVDVVGIKIGDGVKAFNALPWVLNPYRKIPAAPFKVRNTDESYSEVENAETGYTDAVITDLRLEGQVDYIVTNTDQNKEFRAEEMIIDPVNYKLTLPGFTLSNGNNISIFPNWETEIAGASEVVIEQLKTAAAPFLYGGAILPFNRLASEIPDGWQEVTIFAGKTLMGVSVTDIADFDWGKEGGAKTAALTSENNGPHSHTYRKAKEFGSASGNAVNHPDGPLENAETNISGTGKPFSILSPYRVVRFIEMIPII